MIATYRLLVFATATLLLTGTAISLCAAAQTQTAATGTIVYSHGTPFTFPFMDSDIHIVNADGTNDRALTADGHSLSPTWSPDGAHILYIHEGRLQTPSNYQTNDQERTHNPVDLYVMDRDGSNVHLLWRFGYILSASWSPDGRTVAVACNMTGFGGEVGIYLLPADGRGQPRLLVENGRWPSWSPDGKKIMFTSKWVLYVIGTDGSGQARLSPSDLDVYNAAWSPDENGSRSPVSLIWCRLRGCTSWEQMAPLRIP